MFNPDMIETGRQIEPPRILIYGEPGIGKTKFASESESPIVLDFEGSSKTFQMARIKKDALTSSNIVLEAIRYLYKAEHPYKTVVLDTVDWLERMLCDEIAKEHKAQAIDDNKVKALGFGRGYTLVVNKFREILHALDYLVQHKGMTVILCCHHKVKRIEEPDNEGYDIHTLKLHDKVRELMQEWCDCILFAKLKVHVSSTDAGFGKKITKGHTGDVVLHTRKSASYLAKSRYQIPDEIPLSFKAFWDAFVRDTGFNQAQKPLAPQTRTAKVVPITPTTPTSTTSAAFQTANGAYNHAEYLEL